MHSFNFYNPTEILYGKGRVNEVGEKVNNWTKTKNILLVTSNSSKKNGLLDVITDRLKKEKINYYIINGIVSNPNTDCIDKAKEIVKTNNIDFILGVGGASVIDTAKTIAVTCKNEEDIWDLICNPNNIKDALPLGVIITLYGSGTEMTNGAVITNLKVPKKRGFDSNYIFPKFSIIDPDTLKTVSKEYLMIGATDMFIHAMEVYFEITDKTNLSDPYLELLIKQMLKEFDKFPEGKENNDNLFWLSTLAQNKFLTFDKENNGEWIAHIISHEFCLKYNFPHGRIVATLFIAWLEYMKEFNKKRIIRFGENVYNMKNPTVQGVINRIVITLKELGNSTNLKDMGVKEEDINELIEKSMNGKVLGKYKRLTKEDVKEIVYGGFYDN